MRRFRIPILGFQIALFAKDQGFLTFEPELRGRLIRGPHSPTVNGRRELDLGVLSRRVITDAGVAFLVDDWDLGTTEISNMNFHGNGTGAVAEAVGDTALGTEVETRAAGTKSQPAANQLRTIGTIAITATRAITEHGTFSASTVGTLWDRSVFTAINVVNGDSIQYTYTCTVNSGG